MSEYRGKKILIGFMSDLNTTTMVAAKAIDMSAFVTAFSASTKQQTEAVVGIANDGQQSADNVGSAKFDGSLDINLAASLLFPLVSATIGSSTQSALSATAWAADVVTEVGDIVSISGGYLVAQYVFGDAETGATEPTGTTDYENLPIDGADANNGVIWKYRENLYNSTAHNTGFCTDKLFIIERVGESCGGADSFDTIATDVELLSFDIEKSDGVIAQKQSISWLAASTKRSSDADYQDINVTSEVSVQERTYNAEHITVRIDGSQYGIVHNFKINHTKKATAIDTIEPKIQRVKIDSPELTGEITLELDPAEYAIVQKSPSKVVTIEFNLGDGESALGTFPKTVFSSPEIVVNGNEPRLMMIQLKPIGNSSQAMGNFNITTATAK